MRLLRQGLELRRLHSDPVTALTASLDRLREVEALMAEAYGREIAGLDVLDVGTGQLLTQLVYFSRRNRVVGVDRDVIVHGFSPLGYLEMLRVNGPQRTVKTVGRKLLRVDAVYKTELVRQLELDRFPRVDVRAMPAEDMTFTDASFDAVYALAVFQHLARPSDVLRQMVRVLRPGGVLYTDFILYTSPTGAHDLRLADGGDSQLPQWAHLRPQYRHLVNESAYLNRLRLQEWRALFDELIPGAQIRRKQSNADLVLTQAENLRREGELLDYELEELCTTKVIVLWRKPDESTPAR